MSQTLSLFVDSYRELNARKMFWITLILSGVFILLFALFAPDGDRMTFLWMSWREPNAAPFYKYVLIDWVLVTIWLSWAAIILALISTASTFPEFITGGAIDLYLAKPIGRLRLFATKYAASLLFVILQATVFAVCALLVVRLRMGEFRWGLLLSIPLLTLLFSYLYAVCVLFGLWTRSTIAALLLTLLVWFAIFGIHQAEQILLETKFTADVQAERYQQRADRLAAAAAADTSPPTTGPATAPAGGPTAVLEGVSVTAQADGSYVVRSGGSARPRERRDEALRRAAEARATSEAINVWQRRVFLIKSLAPKTSETIGLMERSLYTADELIKSDRGAVDDMGGFGGDDEMSTFIGSRIEAKRRLIAERHSRSTGWVVGTSLAFEAVVLGLAAWVFCRRDY